MRFARLARLCSGAIAALMCSVCVGDVLVLKDGTRIPGTLIAQRDGAVWFEHIRAHLRATSVFLDSEVERIEIEEATRLPEVSKPAPGPGSGDGARQPGRKEPSGGGRPDRGGGPSTRDGRRPGKVESPRAQEPAAYVPQRAKRDAVDLVDRAACIRELAELASFGYTVVSGGDRGGPQELRVVEGAVGWYPYPDRVRALDRTVRLEHLMGSPEEEIREIAALVYAIGVDSWRVNRFEERFGDTPEFRKERTAETVWAGLAAVAAMAVNDTFVERERVSYHDSAGNVRTHTIERRVHDDLVAESVASYNRIAAEWRGRSLQAAEVTRLARLARDTLGDEMAAVWRERLMPLLRETIGAGESPGLLAVGGVDEGMMSCGGGASAGELTSVVLAVEARAGLPDSTPAFVYVPTLAGGERVYAEVVGGMRACLQECAIVEGRVEAVSDQGRCVLEKIKMPTGHERESRVFHQKLEERRVACAEASRGRIAEGLALVRLARETYAAPRNPVVASRRLKKAIEVPSTFIGELVYSDEVAFHVEVSITGYDEGTGVYSGSVKSTIWQTTKSDTLAVCGVIVEEVERGAVLGLLNKLPARSVAALAKSGKLWLRTSPDEIANFEQNPVVADGNSMAGWWGIRPQHEDGLAMKAQRVRRSVEPYVQLFLNDTGEMMIQGKQIGGAVPVAALRRVTR